MKAISIEHVSKSFGKNQVLTDIELEVAQGEIFTLLGENGAGKSTLINILTTLSTQDNGTVTILGMDVRKDAGKIRETFSFNAQSNTLDDEFTGMENLMIIARLRGLPKPKQAIQELSERLALGDFLSRKVGTYSGGMRRRVDIAMSLLGNPEIIFLDEPTTGVDPKNRLEIWKIIRELKQAGKTIFLTTQNLDEADQLSDHIGFLNGGRIVLYGTPEQIKHNTQEQVEIQLAQEEMPAALALLEGQVAFEKSAEDAVKVAKAQLQSVIETLSSHHLVIQKIEPVEAKLEEIFLNVTAAA